jgi:hypothetical protein
MKQAAEAGEINDLLERHTDRPVLLKLFSTASCGSSFCKQPPFG